MNSVSNPDSALVEATHADLKRDAEGDAIEAGAQEIEPLEPEEVTAGQKGARFLTDIKDLDTVARRLDITVKTL